MNIPGNVGNWDIVVAGAGPAGAVAATVLARAGRRVLLVHNGPERTHAMGESLIGAARPLLRDLGLLDAVNAGDHLVAVGNAAAWGSSELTTTDFIRDPYGPGWHLNRALFDEQLRGAATAAGVAMARGRVTGVTRTDHEWTIRTDAGNATARWMVDATGRRALLARMMGVARLRDQLAVAVCAWYTATQQDHDARTYIEAVSDGWWYTARVPAGERVVLFHGDPATASELLKNTDRWHAMLAATRHIGRFVENADLVGELSASEACGACLQQVAGDGWLAVGDAALSFDPISSQGIFNALYTGMRGAQATDAAMNGSATALHDYSERLGQVRRAYLQHFHHAYGAEQRWANRPFWKSRAHGVTANTHSEK